jgi:hypothetical protein
MHVVKTLAQQRPILTAALITVVFAVLPLPLLVAAKLLVPGADLNVLALPLQFILTLLPALFVAALGWWRESGFNRPREWRNLHLLWLPVLLAAAPFVMGIQFPALPAIIGFLIITLMIGLSEEMIFRGVLLHILGPTGVLRAAAWSAVLFGLVHATSFALGRDPVFVAAQIVSSMLGGFGMAALRIRLNTIWPLVILHMLNDFVQFITLNGFTVTQAPAATFALKVGFSLIPCLYGLYLLRDAWLPGRRLDRTPAAPPAGA